MGSASLLTAAAILVLTTTATGQQDCVSGPAPPSDLGAFIWANSGFQESNDNGEKEAARKRLEVDFLCQNTINSLRTDFSALVPVSEVDFRTSCSIPLEDSCNLLSSCSPGRHIGGGRRLTQQCMPFFGCSFSQVFFERIREELVVGEILVQPPLTRQTMGPNVTLGICFDGSCNILGVDGASGSLLGALAYKLCSKKYANTTVNDWTALHWAAIMNTDGIRTPVLFSVEAGIKALVEDGADLEARDGDGFTPMHVGSKWGGLYNTPLQAFVDLGADLEGEDNAGNTPLVIASVFGRDAAIQTLLEAGANPNVRYFDGGNSLLTSKTPLHFGSLYAQKGRIVEMLIKAGADVNSTDNTGDTPLQIAEKYGRLNVQKILKKYGAR